MLMIEPIQGLYDSLTLVLSPDYELVESVDFIEGQIDVYHRIKNNGLS